MTASTTYSGTASSLANRAAAEMTYTQHSAKMRDFCYGFFEPAAPQGCCSPLRYRKDSPNLCFTFTGKERDEETGYNYHGARYYDAALLTSWLSVDPLADKYPGVSPYAYCAWNPMKLVDPDGKDVEMNPYLIFNGLDKTLQIWDDNNTPNDYADDYFIGEYNASNNVSLKDNLNGKWEDGVYPMLDKERPHKHYEADGKTPKKEKGKPTLQDSKGGPYGEHGIFRAETFKQDDGNYTEGRGVHAGRNVNDVTVLTSFTGGCIRTTPDAVEAIINAISMYGPLTNLIVQNNRKSTRSVDANFIIPGKNPIVLETLEITASRTQQ